MHVLIPLAGGEITGVEFENAPRLVVDDAWSKSNERFRGGSGERTTETRGNKDADPNPE